MIYFNLKLTKKINFLWEKKTHQNNKNKQYSGIFFVNNYGRSHLFRSFCFSLHLKNKKELAETKRQKMIENWFFVFSLWCWIKAKKKFRTWPLTSFSCCLSQLLKPHYYYYAPVNYLSFFFILIRDLFLGLKKQSDTNYYCTDNL